MKATLRDIKIWFLVISFLLIGTISQAKSSSRTPSSVAVLASADIGSDSASRTQSWKALLQQFREREFSSRAEVVKLANEFQNRLADDESVHYADKVAMRRQMYKLENEKSAAFPEPQFLGFKKTMVDPQKPSRGYVLEPLYK
jgi:hypothetical protein